MDSSEKRTDLHEMSPLLRWTLYRPVTVLVVFVAFLVVGVMAYPRIRLELMPNGITTGSVSVWIPVPDATPQEVMEEITKPCEDRLRTIPGVRAIYSGSRATNCFLRIEYDPEVNINTMVADIRERIDRAKPQWPEGVDRYNLWRGQMDADMPIYIVAVGMEVEQDARGDDAIDVDEIFENVIQNRLLAVDGVARVEFWGLLEKRVTIDLSNDAVSAYNLPVRELISRITSENRNITGGKIRDGDREYLVRSVGKFKSFDDIRQYPIDERLHIGDVGKVGYDYAWQNYYSTVNGRPSKVVVVKKDSMANTLEVCRRVEAVIADLEANLPRQIPGLLGMQRFTFLNQGEIIEVSMGSLRHSGAWGGLFAMLVLLVFFRRFRITLLVTLSIPFSLLITVVWIYSRGGTFNILSIMGMSLGIGMLVDNSIVVVENILRKREGGAAPLAAAAAGLREVGLAVTLATLTTVVVFVPVMFMGDPRFKTIFREVGGPLCISVLASLLVALVFVPQGVVRLFGSSKESAGDGEGRGLVTGRVLGAPMRVAAALERFTAATQVLVLRNRRISSLFFLAILGTTFFVWSRVPFNFDMAEGHGRVRLQIRLPKNLTGREAAALVDRIEKVFYDSADPAVQERHRVRSVTSWFDTRGGGMNLFFEPGVRIKEEDFFNSVRDELPVLPGVTVQLRSDMFDTEDTRKRIRVYVRGPDLETLDEMGRLVRDTLADRKVFPELFDVRRMRDDTREEVRVTVDREVARHYGVDAQSVSNTVAWSLRGAMLPDYETESRELPFWIRMQNADKESLHELDAIQVFRTDGSPVRLSNLASYRVHPGPGDIRRMDGKMTQAFTADADTEEFFELKKRVGDVMKRIPTPEGFEITMNPRPPGYAGDFTPMVYAGVLAICMVFFVMGILFESFILPFSVLLSIPFAFFGSAWTLYLTGIPLDPVGTIGLVMLVGIVVNNAIVLVDTINRQCQTGLDRHAAILEASRIRFRPIWMTALTTIFGLVPLVLLPQKGEGIDYKCMAVVIVAGLATSTFFTLFVVPLVYSLLDDLRRLGLTLVQRPEDAL